MTGIEVVRRGKLRTGDSTKGILRDRAFESEEVLLGQSKIATGTLSGWHHHGTRHLYGYIVSGRLRFDCVTAKIESIEVSPGDFFHIPVGLVHRDVNPDQTMEAIVVNILLGKGPAVVNVPDPSV
ncbi:MAG TPA: cupin domain-containing protein [Candidatus Bathyarchaeia archaeon]|nr:cupin domain-containing protein [Candidatus Bathyarchaeia archaeon]